MQPCKAYVKHGGKIFSKFSQIYCVLSQRKCSFVLE